MRGVFAAVAAVLFASGADAASFDCRRASTAAEKLICGDRELSRLDEELNLAFRDALALTPQPVGLAVEQRAWLQDRDRDPTRETVVDAYRFRLQDLNARRAIDRRRPRWSWRSDLERSCVQIGFPCEVVSAGEVPGSGGELYFQQQSTLEEGLDRTDGVVVFTRDGPDKVIPVLWVYDDAEHAPPEVVASPAGRLLVLPATGRGANRANADVVFREVDGRWRDIDLESWRRELHARLPEGHWVAQGVEYDFAKLTASTPVWKERDPSCCASGGYAHARLELRGDRLALAGLDHQPAREDGR